VNYLLTCAAWLCWVGVFMMGMQVTPPLKQHFEYVLGGECVTRIEKGPDFECRGRDKEHLTCKGIIIITHGKADACMSINVVREK